MHIRPADTVRSPVGLARSIGAYVIRDFAWGDELREQLAAAHGALRDSRAGRPVGSYGYIHSAVDDHSRLAYSEILPDEQGPTAVAFWQRAQAFFAGHGITVRRVLTDNGSCYRSRVWRRALADAGITHKRTRPYTPRTNGKVERYNRTMLVEWAYARPYPSETARRRAFTRWQHIYNHHRPHSALRGHPPVSRVTNLRGQYS